ncbi:MAG: helix-turn-helix domain-containing protein [Sphingomonas sp.]|uniref:helix-turn-helix domain-containing protein n=1 Tax=Sphingomonas sp. TaxID=28214 RepID=UPI001B160A76|nr:helix-turn-helix transcriptional regulator [Sphingomonas sp.]MBO9621567.1 helix-turn-helix domain-containing protein [Sphingomonas sp.]
MTCKVMASRPRCPQTAARYIRVQADKVIAGMQTAAGSTMKRPSRWTPLGALLREWRAARGLSQMTLALHAGTSPRHLSYVETGRSQPSRGLLTALAEALELPLRERNELLVAAGYAPAFPASSLDAPEMGLVSAAVSLILEEHEPYPAFAFDRNWDLIQASAGMTRLLEAVRPGGPKNRNILLQLFDPDDMRPAIANWSEVASELLRHLHHEIRRRPTDPRPRTLLARLTAFPGVPDAWRRREPGRPPLPVVTTALHGPDGELRFFSTLTTFVGASEVVADELRIEAMHPADEATRAFCRALAQR